MCFSKTAGSTTQQQDADDKTVWVLTQFHHNYCKKVSLSENSVCINLSRDRIKATTKKNQLRLHITCTVDISGLNSNRFVGKTNRIGWVSFLGGQRGWSCEIHFDKVLLAFPLSHLHLFSTPCYTAEANHTVQHLVGMACCRDVTAGRQRATNDPVINSSRGWRAAHSIIIHLENMMDSVPAWTLWDSL